MLRHFVRTTLGVCEITLDREGLDLSERGGFAAQWADNYPENEVIGLDDYRRIVKAHLAELYKKQHGREAGTITVNLASHQFIDDLTGWTKLNWQSDKQAKG